MYEIDSRCPCCQARLIALVSVEDLGGDPERGHSYEIGLDLAANSYEIGLDLAPAVPQAGPESCVICEGPFTTAGERLECEASRRRTA